MPAAVGSLRSDRGLVRHGWSGFSGTGCWGELDDIRPLHGMSRNDVILTPALPSATGIEPALFEPAAPRSVLPPDPPPPGFAARHPRSPRG